MRKVKVNKDFKLNTQLVEFIKSVPNLFENKGDVLHNERNVIKRFTLGDKVLVVKRYKRPFLFQRFIYSFFRQTKAKRAFLNARTLRSRGFVTPLELGYIEIWKKGLFEDGYLITEYTEDAAIAELLVHRKEGFCRDLAKSFAEFVVNLHLNGIIHLDLNSTNVLYNKENNEFYFSLIDINRMKVYPKGFVPSKKDCLNNLNRFTGDYDLFEFVLKAYAKKRNWNEQETVEQALHLKKRHDVCRARRKSFFGLFKSKKN